MEKSSHDFIHTVHFAAILKVPLKCWGHFWWFWITRQSFSRFAHCPVHQVLNIALPHQIRTSACSRFFLPNSYFRFPISQRSRPSRCCCTSTPRSIPIVSKLLSDRFSCLRQIHWRFRRPSGFFFDQGNCGVVAYICRIISNQSPHSSFRDVLCFFLAGAGWWSLKIFLVKRFYPPKTGIGGLNRSHPKTGSDQTTIFSMEYSPAFRSCLKSWCFQFCSQIDNPRNFFSSACCDPTDQQFTLSTPPLSPNIERYRHNPTDAVAEPYPAVHVHWPLQCDALRQRPPRPLRRVPKILFKALPILL